MTTVESSPSQQDELRSQTEESAKNLLMALLFTKGTKKGTFDRDVMNFSQGALGVSQDDLRIATCRLMADGEGRVKYTATGLEPEAGAYPMTEQEAHIYDTLVLPISDKVGEIVAVRTAFIQANPNT